MNDASVPGLVAFLNGAPLAYVGFDGVRRAASFEPAARQLSIRQSTGAPEASYSMGEGGAVIFWLTNERRQDAAAARPGGAAGAEADAGNALAYAGGGEAVPALEAAPAIAAEQLNLFGGAN